MILVFSVISPVAANPTEGEFLYDRTKEYTLYFLLCFIPSVARWVKKFSDVDPFSYFFSHCTFCSYLENIRLLIIREASGFTAKF